MNRRPDLLKLQKKLRLSIVCTLLVASVLSVLYLKTGSTSIHTAAYAIDDTTAVSLAEKPTDTSNEDGADVVFPSFEGKVSWIGTGENENKSYLGLHLTGIDLQNDLELESAVLELTSSKNQGARLQFNAYYSNEASTFSSDAPPHARTLSESSLYHDQNMRVAMNDKIHLDLSNLIKSFIAKKGSLSSLSLIIKGEGAANRRLYFFNSANDDVEVKPKLFIRSTKKISTRQIVSKVELTQEVITPIPTITATPSPTPTKSKAKATPKPTKKTAAAPAPSIPSKQTSSGPQPIPTITSQPATTRYAAMNGKILKNGSAITLKGVNWFGFETENHVAHGLWARNWKEMIVQMKSVGFNSVRIPVCPDTLKNVSVSSIDADKNPDLDGLSSLAILDTFMAEFNSQKMYILLDHHRPDCKAISELWHIPGYTEAQWINDLKFMAKRYASYDYFMGIDLKNEPHGSATWGVGNSDTDWNGAAERAGAAVLAANSNIVVFVEGIGENPTCSNSAYGHSWGGNLEPVACTPLATNKIPANKLIYSPHVYGPDVYMQSYFTVAEFPSNMHGIWETQFGYLASKGYTVIPGEWGGKYGNGGDPQDKVWQDALVQYFKSKKICSSFYWDWNPNSGDTGGILQDNWTTPWANKLQMLSNYYASCPG